jgi:hypothetical protein
MTSKITDHLSAYIIDPNGDATLDLDATHPWPGLETAEEADAWMLLHNNTLQKAITKMHQTGYGICFALAHGGDMFMHTTQEGDILLDVTPDAAWIAPLITAATQVAAPRGQIWVLPGHVLTQLLLGVSSLVATSRIVLQHHFKLSK